MRYPATIATIILARPPLGSLVVRLLTCDDVGISGVGDLGVTIQSLVVPSSDHDCIETVGPSGDHCVTDTAAPSSGHYCTKKVAPPSDHFY